MRNLLISTMMMCSCIANAGILPWDINAKLSLGIEKYVAPWVEHDAEIKRDYGLELSRTFRSSGSWEYWQELKLIGRQDMWPDLEERSDGAQYRVEYHINF